MLTDLPIDKANYVGNKRRLAKYIVDKFPEGAKTLFDPMCGCSAVLIEAAKRGLRVTANDLSPTPYWYSKGVFEGSRLSDEDIERLKQAKPHEGWLTSEWKGTFLVEKLEKGIRVTVKGKPDTEELIPMAAVKESIGKAAYAYTEKHLGPREEIGNKGGSLSNRLRAALKS